MSIPAQPDLNRPSSFGDPRIAYALAEFFCGQFAKTIVVFLRCDFGERYFNFSDLVGSTLTFAIYGGVILFVLATGRGSDTVRQYGGSKDQSATVLAWFLGCFLLMSIFHRLISSVQKISGRRWHSRYAGTSYLRFLTALPFVTTYTVQRFIEPVLAIIAASVVGMLSPILGLWLGFAGLSLAATEHLQHRRARNRVLDAIDSQIEAEQIGNAIAGNKTPQQMDGFVLPVPRYFSEQQRETLRKGMARLDPALQAIMDTPNKTEAKT